MKPRTMLLSALVVALSVGSAFAAPSAEHQEWAKGPVSHLMTKQEQQQWKSVKNDEEARKFIDLFWAKRDPSPATPENEMKARFDQLVSIADERFAYQRIRGAMTERGRVWILLGPPSRIETSGPAESVGNIQSGFLEPGGEGSPAAGNQDRYPSQRWIYEKERIPAFAGKQELEFVFNDRYASGDFRMGRSSSTNVTDILAKAQQSWIVSPDARPGAAPAASQVVATVPVPAPVVTAPKAFRTEAYKVAVDEFRKATGNPYKNAYITYGEFITPEGDYFVPVQIAVPSDAGLKADENLTFFSLVEDAEGNIVGVWEEPAKLAASRTDLYYDKSLNLEPGKYKATFGLAKNGTPVTMASAEMDLAALSKDAAGTSRLILSNNIYALSAAQNPDDPFAFGGIKVIPKGDGRFLQADELWYFFELRNPGVDAASNGPKVQVKVDVEGTTTAKKKVKMGAPLSEAVAEPLKGVPGHYGIGSSIPLSGFEPGDYTIKLKVIDTVSKQTYNMEQPFKVTK
jgi:GWxTD domain-containing protein